jgi:hypothetical protein
VSMGKTACGVPMQMFYGRDTGESPVARMARRAIQWDGAAFGRAHRRATFV